MREKKLVERMEARYERLKRQLSGMGPVLQGTITPRTIRRADPETPGQMRDYGPYYQWTWKREARTVTVNLSAEQAQVYGRAIEENRRLEKILGEMRDLSLKILESTTEGVKKRMSRKRPK